MKEGTDYEVTVNQTRTILWVNTSQGECVARFSKLAGIDVHRTLRQQQETGTQCLYCTHGPANTPEHWAKFREAVKLFHDIKLDPSLMEFPKPVTESLSHCAADRDGDCTHVHCPQLCDGEPSKTGRPCPLPELGAGE